MDINLALNDIKKGTPILVVDRYDRENEADIVIAGEFANTDNIRFAMRYARGLMCIPCNGNILDRLSIPMMVERSTDHWGTPFTVSIDAANGISTGMSVHDRLRTISIILDESSQPEDLARPGHLFPLRARNGLLQERQGHTECSIELMKLAKLKETAIIVEVINDDGTMAKGTDIINFANTHELKIISVEDIYKAAYSCNS